MKIVGFQSGHDVSYCVLDNGVPVIHEELERFIRLKEPWGCGLQMFKDYSTEKDVDLFVMGNPKSHDPIDGEYTEYPHHLSHAASAFFSSNFNEAIVFTIDGGGYEVDSATAFAVHEGKDNKITTKHAYHIDRLNIGTVWSKATKDIFGLSNGFPHGHQAGTVMAMAAAGKGDAYTDAFLEWMYHPRNLTPRLTGEPFDIADGLQQATEHIVRRTMEQWIGEHEYVCLSGGVVLNSVLVGKMYDWFPQIKSIFVDPVPYDAGLALGAAQYHWHHVLGNQRITWSDNASPYLGRTYTEGIPDGRTVTDAEVIDLLTQGNIVSVFGGGSESGRRALGNRSILADPRNKDMKDIINEKVKHRQWFRPFAPSILREHVKDWFTKDVDSPYMSVVLTWKTPEKVPAVVHFDNTARLQTVTENDNKWYYNFIKQFGEKTGVPILLNTSFNDREPIVETPEDAVNCFNKTNIDYLYFRDIHTLIERT